MSAPFTIPAPCVRGGECPSQDCWTGCKNGEHQHRWTTWRRVVIHFDSLGNEIGSSHVSATDPPATPGFTRQCACGEIEVSGWSATDPANQPGSAGTAGDGFRVELDR